MAILPRTATTRNVHNQRAALATPASTHLSLAPPDKLALAQNQCRLSPDQLAGVGAGQSWNQHDPSRKGETLRRYFPALQRPPRCQANEQFRTELKFRRQVS